MTTAPFRIHEGGELANYVVRLPECRPVQDIAEQLEDAAHIIGAHGCGFYADEERGITELRFVNYPRAKYGDRTPKHIRRKAIDVAQITGGCILTPDAVNKGTPPNRAVLGLRRGYEGEDLVDPDELTQAVNPFGKSRVFTREMSVISVAPGKIYTEPALELSFKSREVLTRIGKAALAFGQERFSLEVPRLRQVFMIETPLCTEPDETPFVTSTASDLPRHILHSVVERI